MKWDNSPDKEFKAGDQSSLRWLPQMGTQRKKRRKRGQRHALGSKWLELQIEWPSPGISHRADESSWLTRGSLGLTGGLWETWLCWWWVYITSLSSRQGKDGGVKTTPVAAGFLEKASAHALTQAKKTLVSLNSHCSAALDLGVSWLRRMLKNRTQRWLSPRLALGQVVAIAGAYSSLTPETTHNSDRGQFATIHTLIHAKCPYGPCLPWGVVP